MALESRGEHRRGFRSNAGRAWIAIIAGSLQVTAIEGCGDSGRNFGTEAVRAVSARRPRAVVAAARSADPLAVGAAAQKPGAHREPRTMRAPAERRKGAARARLGRALALQVAITPAPEPEGAPRVALPQVVPLRAPGPAAGVVRREVQEGSAGKSQPCVETEPRTGAKNATLGRRIARPHTALAGARTPAKPLRSVVTGR